MLNFLRGLSSGKERQIYPDAVLWNNIDAPVEISRLTEQQRLT
jgi:hypothetical protein